ncbi:tryptophan halogenase family protein [Marinagarivorans cellulosilyticus]|uniref:Tryptophan 7-halogenase n=1 Tax=Marinagarivorans cellulosilyticus TaxID=2721545 RepID=A0AAN2BIT5_9GAMM|nr:tryptophan halogenase family protein [Marinagarivorans cellulosilyticus]BCD96315.1 tryptophan 7-halogenase [Marinagarivorans cellulosilyticus]
MTSPAIENVVIAGGGTAGWMTAVALSKTFQPRKFSITLVESDQIGTIGVGEATIPEVLKFNKAIGLNEDEFIKRTNGSFKLGIEFCNWGKQGDSYIHPFGKYGTTVGPVPFYHYWNRARKDGYPHSLSEFALSVKASQQNKFTRPVDIKNSPLSEIAYAFHFDAGLYAKYLRELAEGYGVTRTEGTINNVTQNDNGFIKEVHLENGKVISGDLFIDCTGFRGRLIEQTLNTGYDNWSHYLPCNAAVTTPSEKLTPLPPYTRATALDAGWQWRIPLQHRTGNGYVFCDKYITPEAAQDTMVKNLNSQPLAEPKLIRFNTGRRRKCWNKNCIAIGLSSGFLEPLESTSIHLIHEAIANLILLFPDKDCNKPTVDKFNARLEASYVNIRDFLVLHYKVTQREDSEFWRYCKNMDVPDTLINKMELYKESGRIFRDNNELFGEVSWLAVMEGQGLNTNAYNTMVDCMAKQQLFDQLENIRGVISRSAENMPEHQAFINRYCQSPAK